MSFQMWFARVRPSDGPAQGLGVVVVDGCAGSRAAWERGLSLSQGAKGAGEEDERVAGHARDAQVVDAPYDDRVIAGGVLGGDSALEGGEGVCEQRSAVASGFPVDVGESVRAGRASRVSRTARAAT
jgi:hypothetical protein